MIDLGWLANLAVRDALCELLMNRGEGAAPTGY